MFLSLYFFFSFKILIIHYIHLKSFDKLFNLFLFMNFDLIFLKYYLINQLSHSIL